MADINETAYPKLKQYYSQTELNELFTPTPDEMALCQRQTRGESTKICFIATLKTFQRLGHFEFVRDIPDSILEHLSTVTKYSLNSKIIEAYDKSRSRMSHLAICREYCGISASPSKIRKAIAEAVVSAATTKEDVADIINVAIEELIRQRFELPAFSTIHRAAKSARGTVNRGFHRRITQTLTDEQKKQIDQLFLTSSDSKSPWDQLKREPGKPSKSHFKELLNHLENLNKFPFYDKHIYVDIPGVKLQQFAFEAKSLDAARMMTLGIHKRYALTCALIRYQRSRCFDDLGDMFIKRMMKIHHNGQEALNRYQLDHRAVTDRLLLRFQDVLQAYNSDGSSDTKIAAISQSIGTDGERIQNDLKTQIAFSGNNYYSFLEPYYKPYRKILFELLTSVPFISTTQNTNLVLAMEFIKNHSDIRTEKMSLNNDFDLSWVPDKWWKLIAGPNVKRGVIAEVMRKPFELCIFSQMLWELKSGDLCIPGSEQYSDYREQLLTWDEYQKHIETYGVQAGIEVDPKQFIRKTQGWLIQEAKKVDESFPQNESLSIENGEPILKRDKKKISPSKLRQTERLITSRMESVNILDALIDTDQWIHWTNSFGPLSGFDTKISDPEMRYILTTFCYGTNLGPAQTARSVLGTDRRQIAWINTRHVTEEKLDDAIKTVVNAYAKCPIQKLWGTGKNAAADGTKWNLYEQNLLSEYHIRYGGYGGIGYYHVSDTYIALFSHFIPCGVWEAVYILDGLLKNQSDIQPDTLHADTQGQSAPVFALSHLLGINLMPRIRNWKDLKFVRPSANEKYQHIESLFSADVDWQLIEIHLPDMLRIVLSIRAGKIAASTILRRLGTYSRKNRLYNAFRELGQVVRTVFLLRYLSDANIRRTIQSATNKSEAFNGYTKWVAFGGNGIIAENSRDEQRKIIKYNHLVSNLLILHTMYGIGTVLKNLEDENTFTDPEVIGFMSPYLSEHINRFGDYRLDKDRQTPAPEIDISWLKNQNFGSVN